MSLTAVLIATLSMYIVNSWQFPLYKQCAQPWANNTMGVAGNGEQATICQEGCAMSDVSMALAALNISIPTNNGNSNVTSNPGTLNDWLQANNGYICIDGDCNNLVLWIINNISSNHLQVTNPVNLTYPTLYDIRRGLDAQDTIFIAHNPSIYHFVLFTQPTEYWLEASFYDNDPGFNTSVYYFNQTYGYLQYNIYGIARSYPYYTQCNATWSDIAMGTDNETICEVGCLMSSVSMAMAAYNIPILYKNGKNVTTTPQTLNWWLQQNDGYDAGTSDLNENALNMISNKRVIWNDDDMHTTNDIAFDVIRAYLQDHKRRVVIANVMSGKHFVLIIDVDINDKDTLYVNDPGQFHDTYSYSKDVVGWRIFDMA